MISEKYFTQIFKWSLGKTRNYHEAEDLTQEILFHIIKAFSKDVIIISEEHYIWKIAYYVWCNRVREYQKDHLVTNVDDSILNNIKDSNKDILDVIEQEEIQSILKDKLNLLNDKTKICMLAYYYDNLSIKDIANKLSIGDSLVNYYLYQGRNILRRELENDYR
jgi:RNA polymerase sigma-70 factor (ECF subfamily)